MSYFLPFDILLLLIYWVRISLPLLAHIDEVADFYRLYDVLLARNIFLILGHLGFLANMAPFGMDFFSRFMPADRYSDLHNLLPNRALLHSIFYPIIDRSVDYSDRRYSFPDILSPDIPFPDSPISHYRRHEPCVYSALFRRYMFHLLLFLLGFLSHLFLILSAPWLSTPLYSPPTSFSDLPRLFVVFLADFLSVAAAADSVILHSCFGILLDLHYLPFSLLVSLLLVPVQALHLLSASLQLPGSPLAPAFF